MVEKFKIESESEADSYLENLLSNKEFRSILIVEERAMNLIPDAKLRAYFISQARKIIAS